MKTKIETKNRLQGSLVLSFGEDLYATGINTNQLESEEELRLLDGEPNIWDLLRKDTSSTDCLSKCLEGARSSCEGDFLGNNAIMDFIPVDIREGHPKHFAVSVDFERSLNQVEKLKQDYEDLLESGKKFSYIITHDLGEPLRSILNFSMLLGEEYEDQLDEEGKQYLYFIQDGSKKMNLLLNNLSLYNKVARKRVEKKEMRFEDVLHLQIHKLQALIQETKAEISFPEDIEVFVDRQLFGVICKELIKNAIAASTGRTPIIDIACSIEDGCQFFRFKDNGKGIEEKNHQIIFEIMERVDSRPNLTGSGIGLAKVQLAARKQGGRINLVESELGAGSIFEVMIPQ